MNYNKQKKAKLTIKNNDILLNKELLDLKSEEYTQDDFSEALITYINSIQNSLNDFVDGFDKITDSMLGENN